MTTETAFADRIKLPFSFDIAKPLAEAKALQAGHYEYYSVIPLRSPAHLVDPSLPEPPPAADYADGSWTPWKDTAALEKSPALQQIVKAIEAYTTVNLVRVLFLAPKSNVREHTDPTLGVEVERSMIRLTIPLDNNDGVKFYLNDTLVPMHVGECWYMRLSDTHRVLNQGDTDRINLTIDVLPNEQMLNLLRKAQESTPVASQ